MVRFSAEKKVRQHTGGGRLRLVGQDDAERAALRPVGVPGGDGEMLRPLCSSRFQWRRRGLRGLRLPPGPRAAALALGLRIYPRALFTNFEF